MCLRNVLAFFKKLAKKAVQFQSYTVWKYSRRKHIPNAPCPLISSCLLRVAETFYKDVKNPIRPIQNIIKN